MDEGTEEDGVAPHLASAHTLPHHQTQHALRLSTSLQQQSTQGNEAATATAAASAAANETPSSGSTTATGMLLCVGRGEDVVGPCFRSFLLSLLCVWVRVTPRFPDGSPLCIGIAIHPRTTRSSVTVWYICGQRHTRDAPRSPSLPASRDTWDWVLLRFDRCQWIIRRPP
jgi:hypothetical protein